jgi:SAM-dependent methyltransferase
LPPDPYQLYELAVTSPDLLAPFLYALHGGRPSVLAEDFSGTAAVSRGWIRYRRGLRAVAVDRDSEVLARAGRVRGLKTVAADVLKVREKADIIAATNFPVCYWHTRGELVRYLRHVRSRLNRGGVFVADLYGGPQALKTGKRTKTVALPDGGEFTYVWDQKSVDPLTGRVFNAIHFRLPGAGSSRAKTRASAQRGAGGRRGAGPMPVAQPLVIRDAFTYDWRLWSIPEFRDALADAGFQSSEVHDRMGAAVDVVGNVYVKAVEEGELDRDYVVYVVGRV